MAELLRSDMDMDAVSSAATTFWRSVRSTRVARLASRCHNRSASSASTTCRWLPGLPTTSRPSANRSPKSSAQRSSWLSRLSRKIDPRPCGCSPATRSCAIAFDEPRCAGEGRSGTHRPFAYHRGNGRLANAVAVTTGGSSPSKRSPVSCRHARCAAMNLGTDMVCDQPDDPFAVGGRKSLTGI